MYKLYGSSNVASFVAHVCLIKADAKFEFLNVDMAHQEQHGEEYLKINPNGKVPVLIDDNIQKGGKSLVLFEAAAICLHIADQEMNAHLFPKYGSIERSIAYKWLIHLTNTLQAELINFHYAIRYTSDPTAVPAIRKQVAIRISNTFNIIDNELSNNPEFLISNQPNICDYYLFMLSEWAHSFEIKNGPMSHPKLKSYLMKLKSLPEIQETIKRENFEPSF